MQPRRLRDNTKKEGPFQEPSLFGGGVRRIRTVDTVLPVYSLSRRAPSTYSAITPGVIGGR